MLAAQRVCLTARQLRSVPFSQVTRIVSRRGSWFIEMYGAELAGPGVDRLLALARPEHVLGLRPPDAPRDIATPLT
jgi:hypothetical protein